MAIRLLSVAVLALAAGTLYALRKPRRADERHTAKPEPEQRWEGEGGALPATGAQMGPEPVAVILQPSCARPDVVSRSPRKPFALSLSKGRVALLERRG